VLPPCGSERETDYGVTESLRDAEVLDRRARARAATKVKLESRLNCNIKVHDLMLFGAATHKLHLIVAQHVCVHMCAHASHLSFNHSLAPPV